MRKIIKGDVKFSSLCLKELLDLLDLSDVEVTGDFTCSGNDLTNLKGAPHTVGGNFHCYYNDLSSLSGAPQTVGGDFDCSENDLINLNKGAPHTVGGDFDCSDNDLTSLEGLPETIDGNFVLDEYLEDKFPEEYIRSLSKIKKDVRYW